ncbi:MAG TPA: rhomboid family intramembrane serine protease [Caulobacteraceae bacterium]
MTDDHKEPLFNAPWPAVLLAVAIVAAYVWQLSAGGDALVERYAVSASALRDGRYGVLVTSLFLHGGWAHDLGNAVFALAFATPVSRRMGTDPMGSAMFFIFYLVCGLISGLAFAASHWADASIAAGASGAVAGCMGAASRLMGPGPGLAPFRSRPVVSMAVAWLGVNALFGLFLVGWAPGSGGAPLAWEAHLGGYAAGLILIGPTLWFLGRA